MTAPIRAPLIQSFDGPEPAPGGSSFRIACSGSPTTAEQGGAFKRQATNLIEKKRFNPKANATTQSIQALPKYGI
jgi:hypothetical protein